MYHLNEESDNASDSLSEQSNHMSGNRPYEYTVQTYFTFNYLHQRRLANIGDNLGIDFAIAFVDAEDDGFTQCSATTFASHITRTEIEFVQFDLAGERRFVLAEIRDSLADKCQRTRYVYYGSNWSKQRFVSPSNQVQKNAKFGGI